MAENDRLTACNARLQQQADSGENAKMRLRIAIEYLQMRNDEVKALRARVEVERERCAAVAHDYLLRMGHTVMAGYVKEEISKSV